MRVRPRLFAVVSFVAVGLLALVVAGVLDWLVGVLFLTMEFLGEVLRSVFRRRRGRRRPPTRVRHTPVVPLNAVERPRAYVRRGGRPRRRITRRRADTPAAATPAKSSLQVLTPERGGDTAELIDLALEECRRRHAEMILLVLPTPAVTPAGPPAAIDAPGSPGRP